MSQKKIIDRIDAEDTYMEMAATYRYMTDVMMTALHSESDKETLDKVQFFLSLYTEKMDDILDRFSDILLLRKA